MAIMTLLPVLMVLIYFGVLIGILYLIYTWVNKFIALKQEQNDILREIAGKMGEKSIKKE